MLPKLENCSIGIIGLGYVGLPLAIQIAKQEICLKTRKKLERKIYGYDISNIRIKELKKGNDSNNIFSNKEITNIRNIKFIKNKELLKNIQVFIITVPTPINDNNEPNLSYIEGASKLVGELIKNLEEKVNPIIIYESTVYPGVTEEICVPIIEKTSGRKYNLENFNNTFYCGYSPERINPGDEKYTVNSITKVTSGCNRNVGEWIDSFYGSFIAAGTFKASNIKIAEAAKVIENTQRDINIALVNELAILFKKLNINTKEVLEAAGTKWNFQKYIPGLIGGHCIGVDPYYLTYKAKEIGYETKLISAGRNINDYMHKYLLDQIIFHKSKNNKTLLKEVLLLGLSYKSNCGDIRNSQLLYLVENIKHLDMNITIVDPKVNSKKVFEEKGIIALDSIPKSKKYHIIILALKHKEFEDLTKTELLKFGYKETLIFDLTYKLSGEGIINL